MQTDEQFVSIRSSVVATMSLLITTPPLSHKWDVGIVAVALLLISQNL